MPSKAKDSISKKQALIFGILGASAGTAVTSQVTQSAINLPSLFGEQTPGKKLPTIHKELRTYFAKRYGVRPKVHTRYGGNPVFVSKPNVFTDVLGMKRGVNISHLKHPEILAHELGHAVDFKKYPKLKSFARIGGPMAGIVAASVLLSDPEKRKYAPAVAAAGFAPTVYQEAKASVIGLKSLKGVLGQRPKGATSRLLKALGTYATLPAGAALGVGIIGKLFHKEEQDNASRK